MTEHGNATYYSPQKTQNWLESPGSSQDPLSPKYFSRGITSSMLYHSSKAFTLLKAVKIVFCGIEKKVQKLEPVSPAATIRDEICEMGRALC